MVVLVDYDDGDYYEDDYAADSDDDGDERGDDSVGGCGCCGW